MESWEERLPNNEGEGAVTLGDEVKHALRYRPDWLVFGEVRDSDGAVPMLKAMTHGQSSLTTVHSATALGALDKLALYLGTGEDRLPPEVAHHQLHQAVDFVVHLDRVPDGRRVVAEVIEVAGFDGRRCTTNTWRRDPASGEVATLSRLEQPTARRWPAPGSTTPCWGVGSGDAGRGARRFAGRRRRVAGRRRCRRGRRPPRRRACVAWEQLWWRAALVAGAGVAGWAVTGWPAAGVLAGAAAGVAPMLVGTRRRRERLSARSEALASWAEMLRDTIAAHAGLREAIAATARVAPVPIRAEVQALAVRAEREPLTVALRRFAVEVADPVADLIVAALVIAAERQAHRLAELLSQIATAAREQAAMRIRVETGRARTYASSQALVAITFALAVGLLVFSPTFMEPYDMATGQVVLVAIGALFAGALWSLVLLGRPAATPRLLAGIEDERRGGAPVNLLAVIAAALAGAGLLLVLRGMVGITVPLAEVVADCTGPALASRR